MIPILCWQLSMNWRRNVTWLVGRGIRLTDEGVSIPMDKYVQTEITAFLVVDPSRVENPRPRDDEEEIEIVRGISAKEIINMVRRGDMNLVGAWASLLALEKLRDLGEIR